jgi:superfamily II DNA or RNA helicase
MTPPTRDLLQERACQAATPNGYQCLACRVGKTRVKAKIAARFVAEGKRVLIGVDREVTLKQAPAEFAATGLRFSTWHGTQLPSASDSVVLTTVQTAIRHPRVMAQFDQAILDEGDLRCGKTSVTLSRFREFVGDVLAMSGTMTNFVNGKNVPVIKSRILEEGQYEPRPWNRLDLEITPHHAIAAGATVPCRDLGNEHEFRRVGRASMSGDYDISEQCMSPRGLKMVLDATRAGLSVIIQETRLVCPITLIHASKIEHAEALEQTFYEYGLNAISVHSKTDNRDEIMRGVRAGEYQVVIGVNALGRGFDLPEIMLVVLAMCSVSHAGILQRCARGGNAWNVKQYNSIVDLGGNLAVVGDPDAAQSEVCDRLDRLELDRIKIEKEQREGSGGGKGETTLNSPFKIEEKLNWYAAFLWVCDERGHSKGRAYHLFREKFHTDPPWSWRSTVVPVQPSAVQRAFVHERNVAYAKLMNPDYPPTGAMNSGRGFYPTDRP